MTINNYLTLTDVKAYMPNNAVATTTEWDIPVTTLTGNLSRAFDTLTFRNPGDYAVNADTTQYYNGVPQTAVSYAAIVTIEELASAPTSVSISPNGDPNGFVALAASDYFLAPYNAGAQGKPYYQIELNTATGSRRCWPRTKRSIQVVGKFGYSTTVPLDVLEAMLLYVARLLRKAQENYQEVGTLLDSGQVLIGAKQDDDLSKLIMRYQHWRDG